MNFLGIKDVGDKLSLSNKTLCVGFISGPVLLVISAVQLAFNLIVALFTALPTWLNCVKQGSVLDAKTCLEHSLGGLIGIVTGIYMFIPGTSFL